ncbi:TlpA family protein disulfide reductase [Simplicispira lacusdiani]|uniref:TlpA family protein disulfide reductase n=1 Tax=Simplicispira lacusdiani TaxID=2213010 RepID=UPI003522B12B
MTQHSSNSPAVDGVASPGADVPTPAGARRRHLLYAGVAAAAALGGGWAWWRANGSDAHAEAARAFWGRSFETPAGATQAMAAFQGKPLLLNFWATWCPPCIAELPLLNGFYREHAAKGWQVVGIAIDQPSAVRAFLERAPVDFPVVMAGLGGTDLSRALGNLGGGLPFTVLFDADGRIFHRKIGQITPDDLRQWVSLG